MSSKPFRPAREVAIAARRTALQDPASYDPGPPAATPAGHTGDVLASHPARLGKRPRLTLTLVTVAAGLLLLAAMRPQLLGPALVGVVALGITVARLVFPPGFRGRRRQREVPDRKAGTR